MYKIINEETIQKKIEELNKTFKLKTEEKQALKKLVYSDNTDEILILDTELYGLEVSIEELENILSNSIPLIAEIEKGYNLGLEFDGKNDMGESKTFENYISQLKLDI